jgi:large subunit ribosomal protein L4
MPKVDTKDAKGANAGTVDLDDAMFGIEPNVAVMHQVVTAQLAHRRSGTQSTKTRSDVRGGGAKPYRQKGTGRARQGSRSAPHYKGGGVVFGPHPRSYEQRLPKRMKRAALHGVLTAKYGDGAIRVVDELGLDAPKTRDLVGFLGALTANGRVLIVATGSDSNLEISARNLPQVVLIRADSLNVVDVINADTVLITQPSLDTMAQVYA